MSHQDYIAECDESQLDALIHLAKERQKAIWESGYVTLWVISNDWCNFAWFDEDRHEHAFQRMLAFALKGYKPGIEIKWSLKKTRMRPEEAAEALRVNVPMEKL